MGNKGCYVIKKGYSINPIGTVCMWNVLDSKVKFLSQKERNNSSTNDKILAWSKLKAFADNKINATQKLKFALGGIENIVGTIFSKGYLLRVI